MSPCVNNNTTNGVNTTDKMAYKACTMFQGRSLPHPYLNKSYYRPNTNVEHIFSSVLNYIHFGSEVYQCFLVFII